MRDETAKDNRQTAAWISHDLTQNNELALVEVDVVMVLRLEFRYKPKYIPDPNQNFQSREVVVGEHLWERT